MKIHIRRLKISAFILSILMLISLSSCAQWLNEYFGFTNPYSQNKKNDEPGTPVEDSNMIQIGDIVMSDGSYLEASAYSSYRGTAKPAGVICKLNEDGKSGLMLGLNNSSSDEDTGWKLWAPEGTTGYNTNFTAIVGTIEEGDIDGSDNWEEICKVDTEGTKDPATNYPAFNYALTYAATAGLEGTEYAEGWYMPTVYELHNYVYQNKTTLNASLTVAGGTPLASDVYWSSSQYDNYYYHACVVDFSNGIVYGGYKDSSYYVCCLRVFGEKPETTLITKTTAEIGDIALSDGTFISADDYPDYNGRTVPVGVVCKLNEDGKSGLMLGLSNSSAGTNSGYKQWARDGSTGYNTKFTDIMGTKDGGDIDGSDNWEEICKVDTEGTKDPAANYPAFNYALNYAKTAGLEGTEYAEGWYMPTVYELYNYIYQNRSVLNASLTASGGTTLAINTYWSSSQYYYYGGYYAWAVYFYDGYVYCNNGGKYVCCLRAFGEKTETTPITKTTAEIGDIALSDGTFISSDVYPDYNGSSVSVGVVCKVNEDGTSGLMLGLSNSSSDEDTVWKLWAPEGTTGYNTNFTAIVGTIEEGDIDGSDNWEEICKVDTEGTADPVTNYPAFDYALTYAKNAGLEGTEYAEGWYVPSQYELYNYVYLNNEEFNASLTVAGGTPLASDVYWSSSQHYYGNYYAWVVDFSNGIVYGGYKDSSYYVCCLKAF